MIDPEPEPYGIRRTVKCSMIKPVHLSGCTVGIERQRSIVE
jgi:hypothetical protein